MAVEKEQLKKGLVIWWTRSGDRAEWSCPCIVTHVDVEKNRYRVFSFDDFKETGDLLIDRPPQSDPSSLKEMTVSNMAEVTSYLKGRKKTVEKHILEIRQQLASAESYLAMFDKHPLDIVKESIAKAPKEGEVVDLEKH